MICSSLLGGQADTGYDGIPVLTALVSVVTSDFRKGSGTERPRDVD